ncbi:glutamyl-tRNA reductase-binding protein, chloroplastic isoform X2 [Ziziphus jujuba]|uniref:Glutamyl-tRNA reductase-binding protein, chloroplastic isoform X2 n=1 Tax=Ziziphus jujuba TaxID=326968 RepID=A0ABM3ZZ30_ZIZJJ|nr:glutamyl-tRNA reductase-binding protein, chloroplastic isoform X2 [Ziziphus jujuba]
MLPQTQSLTSHLALPIFSYKANSRFHFTVSKPISFPKTPSKFPKCSRSTVSEPTHLKLGNNKPVPAEVSRTIMELSSVGTLSTLTEVGWPLGIGVRFAVDHEGTPVLCLNSSNAQFSTNKSSSLHVQLDQCGLRTPQCTILGNIDKPEDRMVVKRLNSIWKKRFGEGVDENLMYVVSVERVLQMEDFEEVGNWINSSDYRNAPPDPLRDIAEKLVNDINIHNIEDVNRFCNIFVDLEFPVSEAKLIWVDRLGFDMRIWSPQAGIFEVRIPFPSEVSDEKGAKSTFNSMSQLAWEVEKNFYVPDFQKVTQLKRIT